MPADVPITAEGLAAVKAEVEELTKVRRPAIVEKIKAARELGDLSENIEYHSAKNEQGFIESRIAELEAIIKNHTLIEAAPPSDHVEVGSTVRFQEEGGPEEAYRIVGSAEADPKNGRVSFESAIGKAMLGKRPGQSGEVEAPGGSYTVKILAIESSAPREP